jgi:NADH-quinone oxidoreductase subunit J
VTASVGETVTFWALAVVSVVGALGVVFMRRAVHSALMLATVMGSLAVLYAVLEAPFLAFVQIIVYTGAVLMLFLFVLMLVGVSSTDSLVETIKGQRLATALAGFGFLSLMAFGLGNAALTPPRMADGGRTLLEATQQAEGGNLVALARLIFTKYVFAFEVTSALLITAALGAMVLAHRERLTPKPSQKSLSKLRFKGPHPTPLPGPGTYARHNAIDMPALLPDGSDAELSINPVLARRQSAEPQIRAEDEAEGGAIEAGDESGGDPGGESGDPGASGKAATSATSASEKR